MGFEARQRGSGVVLPPLLTQLLRPAHRAQESPPTQLSAHAAGWQGEDWTSQCTKMGKKTRMSSAQRALSRSVVKRHVQKTGTWPLGRKVNSYMTHPDRNRCARGFILQEILTRARPTPGRTLPCGLRASVVTVAQRTVLGCHKEGRNWVHPEEEGLLERGTTVGSRQEWNLVVLGGGKVCGSDRTMGRAGWGGRTAPQGAENRSSGPEDRAHGASRGRGKGVLVPAPPRPRPRSPSELIHRASASPHSRSFSIWAGGMNLPVL